MVMTLSCWMIEGLDRLLIASLARAHNGRSAGCPGLPYRRCRSADGRWVHPSANPSRSFSCSNLSPPRVFLSADLVVEQIADMARRESTRAHIPMAGDARDL